MADSAAIASDQGAPSPSPSNDDPVAGGASLEDGVAQGPVFFQFTRCHMSLSRRRADTAGRRGRFAPNWTGTHCGTGRCRAEVGVQRP